jgi:hypothetical protein
MSNLSPRFDARQLNEELVGKSYLLPTDIEIYVRNLVRIVGEQQKRIEDMQRIISEITQ